MRLPKDQVRRIGCGFRSWHFPLAMLTRPISWHWRRPTAHVFIYNISQKTYTPIAFFTMTSSNGNIFRVTGPLCGEFTGHRSLPRTKASDAELWCFLWSAPWGNGWVNNREAGDLRRQRAHYDVIVMHMVYCGLVLGVLTILFRVTSLLNLIILFSVTSLALGQSYNCPNASEGTLNNMVK